MIHNIPKTAGPLLLVVVVGITLALSPDRELLAANKDVVVAKIMMRVLTFDRQLKIGAGAGDIVMAVLHNPDSAPAKAEKDALVAELRNLSESHKLGGKSWTVVEIAYGGPDGLKKALVAQNVKVLLVTAGLDAAVGAVSRITREQKVGTLTTVRSQVEGGLSVGVVIVGGKPKILVNLKASKNEGMDLSGQMLRMAEIVE